MIKFKSTLSIIFLISLFSFETAFAKSKDTDGHVYAIQNRVFHKNHELSFATGYVADDDFYNVYPAGIAYTFNFNDHYSWEVIRGEFMINKEKDLKGNLEAEFGATPSEFMKPVYSIHTNFLLRPFYGKESVWNKRVLNHETYFILGGGIANYEKKYVDEPSDTENVISISVGAGKKYFINQKLCMNFEIRDFIRFKEDNTENTIFFGVSLGLRFNLLPRKSETDKTIDKIKEYLEKSE